MSLHAHASHRHALRLQPSDEVEVGLALRCAGLDVEVVEVQHRGGVGLVRPTERIGDGLDTEPVDERVTGPQRAVVVDDLVRDVPGGDAPRVVADDGRDVVVQDVAQLVVGEAAFGEPGRVAPVPEQVVAAHLLVVRLREVEHGVRGREVVAVALRVDGAPLERVLRCQGRELRGQQRAVRLVGRQRVRVVGARQVAAADDGRADEHAVRRDVSQRGADRRAAARGDAARAGAGGEQREGRHCDGRRHPAGRRGRHHAPKPRAAPSRHEVVTRPRHGRLTPVLVC